jgi:hypothetical protein
VVPAAKKVAPKPDSKTAVKRTPPAGPINPLAGLAALGDFDANVKVRLKALTFKEVPIRGLSLEAQLFDGQLKLTEFRTANAAGLALNVSGNIKDLRKSKGVVDPSFDNFKFNIRGKSLAKLLSLAKITPPISPRQIGPVRLSGSLNGKPRALKVTPNTSMLGGKFTLNGLVEPLRPAPRVDGQFSASPPSLIKLVRKFGSTYQPRKKNFGSVNLRGSLKGDAQKMLFSSLSGSAAGITVQGSAATDLSGARPKITADLKTSPIVIDDILPTKQTAFLDQKLRHQHWFG